MKSDLCVKFWHTPIVWISNLCLKIVLHTFEGVVVGGQQIGETRIFWGLGSDLVLDMVLWTNYISQPWNVAYNCILPYIQTLASLDL